MSASAGEGERLVPVTGRYTGKPGCTVPSARSTRIELSSTGTTIEGGFEGPSIRPTAAEPDIAPRNTGKPGTFDPSGRHA